MKGSKKNVTKEEVSSTKRGLQVGYDRVTFIVKEETAYKLNCIASREDAFLKVIVNEALEKYIQEWEKNNYKIPKKKLR